MKKLLQKYFSQSSFLLFLPFLVLFLLLVFKMHNDTMHGDEGRYVQFAENLCHGFYSPPPPDINLWNGPAYPLFLMPFVLLKLPLICITLANAFMQYLSIVFLFSSRIAIDDKIFLFPIVFVQSFLRGAGYFNGGFLIATILIILIVLKSYDGKKSNKTLRR